jgi:hypothetical protein
MTPDFRHFLFPPIFSFGAVGTSIIRDILWTKQHHCYIVLGLLMDQTGNKSVHPVKILAIVAITCIGHSILNVYNSLVFFAVIDSFIFNIINYLAQS